MSTSPPLVTVTDPLPAVDVCALFAAAGAPTDAILLEAADHSSRPHTRSLAVMQASLRVRGHDDQVTVTALTQTGRVLLERLAGQLASAITDQSEGQTTFCFPRSTAADERVRLTAPSTIEVLRRLQLDAGHRSEHLPLVAGGFAFDHVASFETLPPVPCGANAYADIEFVVAETLVTADLDTGEAVVTSVGLDAEELRVRHRHIITLATEVTETPPAIEDERTTVTAVADVDDATFMAQVAQMQQHITAGDIYQVVLSRSFQIPCPDTAAAYRELRATNPSPYLFWQRGSGFELIGASPETNLRFDAADRRITLRPIAGTRPRGATDEVDIRAELELRTDAKELAEHTMLVDLGRNDLARVARPGTRRVAELLTVERYSRVMHLVSLIEAELADDLDALDAYRACMTMGTLTGAPKLRATELIGQVEGKRRGSYGGAIGYLAPDGSMDTAIVIRAAYITAGVARVQAGAGVVRDSLPRAEADETVHKASAVLAAIAHSQGARLEVAR